MGIKTPNTRHPNAHATRSRDGGVCLEWRRIGDGDGDDRHGKAKEDVKHRRRLNSTRRVSGVGKIIGSTR